jgi:hypothetical protein
MSASVSGKSYQVTQSEVTEPGLQVGSPTFHATDLRCSITPISVGDQVTLQL